MRALWRSRFRRLVQNPVVTGVLCLLLWKDWSDWSRRPPPDDYSPLLEHLFPRRMWAGRVTHPTPFAYVVRESGTVRCIDPDAASWDELSKIVQTQPESIASATLVAGREYTGWWAPTRSHVIAEVRISPLATFGGFGSMGEGRDVARAEFIEWCKVFTRPQWQRIAREVRARDLSETSVIWSGYGHNAIAAMAALLMIFSSAWLLHAAAWAATLRSRRRFARGQCVECGYDLRGLKGTCPECGSGAQRAAHVSYGDGQ